MNEKENSLRTIFIEAVEISGAAERDIFLQRACGDDVALREKVERLIEAHADVEHSAVTEKLPAGDSPISEKPGDKIGRYKLREKIGEGGCGVVYVADQEEPVRRRVALKVIKLGMDTRQVVARFEAERQALAMMDHLNIAKVLDAGATDTGRPFFVMELVRGIKITDYCDQHNLATEERLKLVIQVCSAIQHAHQKGIIHRDIKPSNILVTQHDGRPVPKVIDFGIAKATADQRLTDKTIYTAFEQFIGTPAYMSPEQAEMSGLDIDTRSDIYSLGVLLYELLTGRTPFEAKVLLQAGLDEMRRIIREQEPVKPSTRLSTLADADLTEVARHRQVEAPKLLHVLRGDLDWIVMKALEKDRTRRYETANGLVMDIQRHLDHEPVLACPPSAFYRFLKLVRRNKLAFAAATSVAAALILGLGLSTWLFLRERAALKVADENSLQAQQQARRAESETVKSQLVAQFLKAMLDGVGPSVAQGRDITLLREILNETASRLPELKNHPEVQADLGATLANVYADLGDYVRAERMYREVVVLRKQYYSDEHPNIATTLNSLAELLVKQGRPAEAEVTAREALAMRRKLLGEEHVDVSSSLDSVARAVEAQGNIAGAETLWREALALRRKLVGNEDASVAYVLHPLAWTLHSLGRRAEAEALSREEQAIWRKLYGNEHPRVGWALNDLAIFLREQGKTAEAEATAREALAIGRGQLSGEPVAVGLFLQQLASVLSQQAEYAEAESICREELSFRRRVQGNQHPDVAVTLQRLAGYLRARGKSLEAETALREALTIQRERLGDSHPGVADTCQELGNVLHDQNKLAEAEPMYREVVSIRTTLFGAQHPQVASSQIGLAFLLTKLPGRQAEAEAICREALALLRRQETGAHSDVAFALDILAGLRHAKGEFAEAEATVREALAVRKKLLGDDHPDLAHTLYALVGELRAQGKLAEAETVALDALDLGRTQLGNEHLNVAHSLHTLASVRRDQGRLAEAEASAREALAIRRKLLGEEHSEVAFSLQELCGYLREGGKLAEAETTAREALALRRTLLGSEHRDVDESLVSLARVLRDQGRFLEAEAVQREELALEKKLSGEEHPFVANSLDNLAAILRDQGALDEAESVIREALAMRRKLQGNDDPALAGTLAELTNILLAEEKYAEAEPLARECLAIREKKLPDDWRTFNARALLGRALLGQQQYADAEPQLLAGYEGIKQRENQIPVIGRPRLKETLQSLVQLYEATNRPDEAAEWKRMLAEFDKVEAELKAPPAKP